MKWWIEKELTIPNPEYAKKERMGFWLGRTPKVLTLYEKAGNEYRIPWGCKSEVEKHYGREDIEYEDKVRKFVSYGKPNAVPLYDYQIDAVDAMVEAKNGILQSKAGSGKTQMGVAIAGRFLQSTLWITHTADLLHQSYERAALYYDPADFGTITEGKVHIGKTITFATVQTLANIDLTPYRNYWNVIIVDECHRVAGTPTQMTQFSKVLNSLWAEHKYGLSATVHRADGLIKCTYALLGNVAYTVPDSAVADKTMTVQIRPVPTGYRVSPDTLNPDGTMNYTLVVSELCKVYSRNELIIKLLAERKGHSVLVLTDRIGHLETLMEMLPNNLRESACMVTGTMTSKTGKELRQSNIEQMRTGEKKILFATFRLAKEGLDIPRLDTLVMATPQKDYAIVTQSIGRIARTFDGKETPVVYDLIDNFRYANYCYRERCRSYRKAGCEIL